MLPDELMIERILHDAISDRSGRNSWRSAAS